LPAYAGIPVTHRGVAASLAIVTGRAGPIGEAPDVEWERIAGADTIVLLMGVANHEPLVRTLMHGGRRPDTPVAAIRWGTTAQQRVVVGTLATIGARMQDAGLRPPAILVVGEVVSLLERMRWAERRPLFGRRVLVPAAYPSPVTEPLEDLGAEVLHVAPVEVLPPASWDTLERALGDLASFTGLVVADEVGVAALFERLAALGRDARALAGCRLVAAGEGTAIAIAKYGIRADRVVEDAEIANPWDAGSRGAWLVVGSPDAQAVIAGTLRRLGATCMTPAVGVETAPKWRADRLRELLTTRPVNAIAFLSATEVRRLLSVLDPDERRSLHGVILAASRAAAAALRRHGLDPSIVAADSSARTLAEILATALHRDQRE
jgi:uroporphyrinogen III methyltransferase/synthase